MTKPRKPKKRQFILKTASPAFGMSDAEFVKFSPNEPGIPFGDNLAHLVSWICCQFGDKPTPALPPIRLLPVTNSEIWGCF